MSMKILPIIKQDNPELINAALKIESIGSLTTNANDFAYLDISFA